MTHNPVSIDHRLGDDALRAWVLLELLNEYDELSWSITKGVVFVVEDEIGNQYKAHTPWGALEAGYKSVPQPIKQQIKDALGYEIKKNQT